MTTFSPKAQFVRSVNVEDLKKNREASWLTTAFTFSLAEMAHKGASAEQLAGARTFISTFQNLWEEHAETPTLPPIRLNADNPQPLAEKPEDKK